jgi:tetratricopeptide (TPR) repeat protein
MINRPSKRKIRLERLWNGDWAFSALEAKDFLYRKFEDAEMAAAKGDMATAIRTCQRLVESCPEYFAAANLLAEFYRHEDEIDKAIACYEATLDFGLTCIPDEFEFGKDTISWDYDDNRSFLLAWERLATCYALKALETVNKTLALSPRLHGLEDRVNKIQEIVGDQS